MPVRLPSPDQVGLSPPTAVEQPASYQGGIAQQGAEQASLANAQSSQQVSQTGAAFLNAQDQLDYTGAINTFLHQKTALDQQFENDTDYATKAQRYSDALDNVVQDATNQIPNIQMRRQFVSSMRYLETMGVARMQSQAHYASVQADRQYITSAGDSAMNTALNAPDSASRTAAITNYSSLVDAAVKKGSVTPAEGDIQKQKFNQTYATRLWDMRIAKDPAAAARMLASGSPALSMNLSEGLGVAIQQVSERTGVPESYLQRTAMVESSGGRNLGPSSASATGPFGFTPGTAASLGVTNPNDPMQSAEAAARLYEQNLPAVTAAVGHPATDAEMYVAHQQGGAGAVALFSHPNENAAQVLAALPGGNLPTALDKIVSNGGTPGMTGGQFTAMWEQRFNAASVSPSAGGAVPSVASAPGQAPDASGLPTFAKTGDSRDYLPPDVRMGLWQKATIYAQQRERAVSIDQERAARQQAALQKQASDDDQDRIVADINHVGPDKNGITAAMIADPDGPFPSFDPATRQRMIALLNHTDPEARDQATYGGAFYPLLHRLTGPPGGGISRDDIYGSVGNGLTLAGATQLVSILKAQNAPAGVGTTRMLRGAVDYAKRELSFAQDNGILKIRDPNGETAFETGFLPTFFHAYAEDIKNGKTPYQLLSRDSPDFIVDKLIAPFKRTQVQWAHDMMKVGLLPAASGAVSPPPLKTASDIVNAYRSGYFGRGPEAVQKAMAAGVAIGLRPAPATPSPVPVSEP